MGAVQNSNINKVFDVIAEEVGVSKDELEGDAEFTELGIDNVLSKSILSRISDEAGVRLPATAFNDFPTASSLKSHLERSLKRSTETASTNKPARSVPDSANPLSIVLQGKLASAKKTIFLLPDGSGSAMAYLRLPAIDPSVCLVGMNSPFLRSSTEQNFSVEGIAAIWAEEIRRRQPQGPYILGGWSAGGYYSFEVAKHFMSNGEGVEKLVLIDSPCRLVYEELPMEVVHYLSNNNLMGDWGTKQPPAWMVNHFDLSIRAISEYVPTPMEPPDLPEVLIIWAKEGVLKGVDSAESGLDFSSKVTRMLIQRPESDGPLGWDMLFPGATLSFAKMPGNHFTIVYPPNVSCAN